MLTTPPERHPRLAPLHNRARGVVMWRVQRPLHAQFGGLVAFVVAAASGVVAGVLLEALSRAIALEHAPRSWRTLESAVRLAVVAGVIIGVYRAVANAATNRRINNLEATVMCPECGHSVAGLAVKDGAVTCTECGVATRKARCDLDK